MIYFIYENYLIVHNNTITKTGDFSCCFNKEGVIPLSKILRVMRMGANFFQKDLEKKIKNFAPWAEAMPAVVIVQQLEPFESIYMNSNGLKGLGITLEGLRQIGSDYLQQFFNIDDAEDFLSKLKILLTSRNSEESFSFLQQVKLKEKGDWVWHIGSTRIFYKDAEGKPTHLVTTAIPIDELKHIPNKAKRLLAESEFLRNNVSKFLSLSSREREILQQVAMGKSSIEIAKKFYISTETVNTHRKNIKSKLGITTTFDFTRYAQAFDLM